MLAYPNLVTSAAPGFYPRLDGVSLTQQMRMLGRMPSVWYQWRVGNQPPPPHVCAYLQLLHGSHPEYDMHWSTDPVALRALPTARYPHARTAESDDAARRWRLERGVTEDDVAQLFGADTPALLRKRSPRTVGRDPVRWTLLRLAAADPRCGAWVSAC